MILLSCIAVVVQELLLDSYQDPNQIITRNDNGGIISSQSDGPGAPGGSSICEQIDQPRQMTPHSICVC
jgi:hypothetical protein